MDGRRRGLLASTGAAALALAAGWTRFRLPDDGAGGGGGGAEALLDDDDPAAAAAAAAADDKGGGGDDAAAAAAAAAAADDKPGEVTDWMKQFSAEAPDAGELSNQEWLAKTGVKDPDALAKRMRDTEKALRDSGRVKIPGADAKPEEIKAYREAIGVPETAEGYEIKLPDGIDPEKFELDGKFLDPLRKIALEQNVPATAFAAFANAFMEQQAEDATAVASANNTARDAKVKAWGTEAPARKEEFRRGVKILGLDNAGIQRMQSGYGVGETMDLIAKVGNMAGEDFFANGEAAERFGVADLEGAKKALETLDNDPANHDKLRKGHASFDANLVAKRNRLIEAVAHFRDVESKK